MRQLRVLCRRLLPACPARLPAALPPGQGGIETYLTLTQTSARCEYYLWAVRELRRLECEDCKDSAVWGGTVSRQGSVGGGCCWGQGVHGAGETRLWAECCQNSFPVLVGTERAP